MTPRREGYMTGPIGSVEPRVIAGVVCRELGYLCLGDEGDEEARMLVASELAVLETYSLVARVLGWEKGYRVLAECLWDEACTRSLLDTVSDTMRLYLGGEDYFFSMRLEDLARSLRIAERLAFGNQDSQGAPKRIGVRVKNPLGT